MKTLLLIFLMGWAAGQSPKVKTEHVDLVVKENVYAQNKYQYSIYLYYRIIETDHVERSLITDTETQLDIFLDKVPVKRELKKRQIYALIDTSRVDDTELLSVKPYRFLATKWGKKRQIVANSFTERNAFGIDGKTEFNHKYPHLELEVIW